MRPLKPLRVNYWIGCVLVIFSFSLSTSAQSYEGLLLIKGDRLTVYYSENSKEQASNMLSLCDKVLNYYDKQIDFSPEVTLLVLSPNDWNTFTNFPIYGMPHYNNEHQLIVASEDNSFWKSFIPPIDTLPKELAESIVQTYSDDTGTLSMRAFFDLLAIHELGHAYHIQGGLVMQRQWMGELFSNILLHTFIAENESTLFPALTLFPKMVVNNTNKDDLKYTTLAELESHYNEIGQQYPNNYGWYQCRWHLAAGNIYDAAGVDAMKNLWTLLGNQQELVDDEIFVRLLSEKVHQSVADVPLTWDAH